MKIRKFEELPIWKLSLLITREIYDITSLPKFSKDFGLRDQLRRAIVSVSSNIVEGFEKNNNNEFIRYLQIAKGSAGEARNQIYIALSATYISESQFNKVNKLLEDLARQIGGFIIYLEKQRQGKQFIQKRKS